MVMLTDMVDWTEMEVRAENIRAKKLKNAAGRPPCRRRRLRVPLSPGSPVPRDPPGDFETVLRPGRRAM
jgi:hypothetical protein